MKMRYFLKGLGTGILITTFIMYFSYKDNLSDAEIIMKAKNLGMVFSDEVSGSSLIVDNEPVETKKPKSTKIPEIQINTPEPVITEVPKATSLPETTKEPEVTQLPDDSEKPVITEKSEKNDKEQLIEFTISRGDWSRVVSEKLETLGIVDDAKKLDKYLVDKGYAVRIRVGTFKLKKNSSYEEIAQMITK